jgi:hypothetical protein
MSKNLLFNCSFSAGERVPLAHALLDIELDHIALFVLAEPFKGNAAFKAGLTSLTSS